MKPSKPLPRARRVSRLLLKLAPSTSLRTLTILNMATMGGTFLVQIISGFVIGLFPTASDGAYALDAYRLVFGLQAAFILLASLAYLGSRDPAGSSAKGSPAPTA